MSLTRNVGGEGLNGVNHHGDGMYFVCVMRKGTKEDVVVVREGGREEDGSGEEVGERELCNGRGSRCWR
jgi:hypothetical protein